MTIAANIFKANDIRGIYNDTLTDDAARSIGRALAAEALDAGATSMALARDGRLSSQPLTVALTEGLCAGGVSVVDIGMAPTPVLYFAAQTLCSGSGVMVTGSHNPPAHNGMKMLIAGRTLKGDGVQELRRRIETGDYGSAPTAEGQNVDVLENYIAAVCCAVPTARALHLVVDAGNGVAGAYAPMLYKKLGHQVTSLYCDVDGNFPNHHPDPAQPENLIAARKKLNETDADIAIVFDGDGDRLGVLLPGREDWVFPDRLLMLLAQDMLSRHHGGRVVFDVKCSANLAPWIEQHGGIADMQPTGHAFIKSRMRETGALLGGEMSGHFYFAEQWFGFDDALLAGARLVAIIGNNPHVMRDIPSSAASPEIVVSIGARDGHAFVRDLRNKVHFPDMKKIVDIDGLRVEYADGFGLVRASNTTASLVLRFEGNNDEALQRITNDFKKFLAAEGIVF
ncbi:phosphomannomutase/phosphoglucomutase [Candidatus Persebacteraceae bacterium Df01]|jgi:phosphomannomutase|uniref:phosphomannomutase n=1 Tax=Candidatus Doriopsillibacter californiensis TaxID=2970740 RepID=A0ABT7QKI6_9GAMM|nr:phosphomannomutase/phosphoglucomutase [Candidatus Persebacteraceae bacterium Df01]